MIDETEFAQLKRDVQQLKDRQAILDCIQRECRARDRQDATQIAGCWWEDGIDEHGANVTQAPDYPARANAGHRALFNMTSHNITNHLCELDGDTAYCESYVVGGLFWQDDKTTTIAFGRYLDQLEKRGGEWRIRIRRCTIEMTADADASWVHSNNIKGFLKARWDGQDPSYERPIVARADGLRW
ncbi:nuclear transport factor 2 family protein [Solimonas terrae]|uniref:Nuclear transport factor 2 family protein n=1 Tax=Solimonas terrae TaxID=1396819 RepID=A0A6M2BPP3_9GAMM|nr:nuclear transport factor 2 family protein [Solimonas terrae]NGY04033.1 nuclear transport factor 2 family protein [Solimonas terrae]